MRLGASVVCSQIAVRADLDNPRWLDERAKKALDLLHNLIKPGNAHSDHDISTLYMDLPPHEDGSVPRASPYYLVKRILTHHKGEHRELKEKSAWAARLGEVPQQWKEGWKANWAYKKAQDNAMTKFWKLDRRSTCSPTCSRTLQ